MRLAMTCSIPLSIELGVVKYRNIWSLLCLGGEELHARVGWSSEAEVMLPCKDSYFRIALDTNLQHTGH